jgi:succinate dehydrogenase hydrophobic anchor subunit
VEPTTARTRTRTRTGGRIGGRGFLVIRGTGVLLAVLALGHFAVTHLVNDVAQTDSSFIARRWSSALWVVWDGLLLVTALAHVGTASLAVVRDYWTDPAGQRRMLTALRGLLLVLLVIGAVTLLFAAG